MENSCPLSSHDQSASIYALLVVDFFFWPSFTMFRGVERHTLVGSRTFFTSQLTCAHFGNSVMKPLLCGTRRRPSRPKLDMLREEQKNTVSGRIKAGDSLQQSMRDFIDEDLSSWHLAVCVRPGALLPWSSWGVPKNKTSSLILLVLKSKKFLRVIKKQ